MGIVLQGHLIMSNEYSKSEVNMFDGKEDISSINICKRKTLTNADAEASAMVSLFFE